VGHVARMKYVKFMQNVCRKLEGRGHTKDVGVAGKTKNYNGF